MVTLEGTLSQVRGPVAGSGGRPHLPSGVAVCTDEAASARCAHWLALAAALAALDTRPCTVEGVLAAIPERSLGALRGSACVSGIAKRAIDALKDEADKRGLRSTEPRFTRMGCLGICMRAQRGPVTRWGCRDRYSRVHVHQSSPTAA